MTDTRPLLNQAMRVLARQRGAIFIGQGVGYSGVAMYEDFNGIPSEQRIEFPVAEELQLGFGIGMALQGWLPILVYPRIDFLLRAMDQLCNHLDKIEVMSRGQWKPKVIIRTRVGTRSPLDAGPQHTQNHAEAFWRMLTTVEVRQLRTPAAIVPTYEAVSRAPNSCLIVECF